MSKKIIVNKFGGGVIVKDFIPLIKKRLEEQVALGYRPVVVVSALKGVTEEILAFLEKLEAMAVKADSDKVNQAIKSFTADLFNKHLKIMTEIGINADWQERVKVKLEKIFFELKKDLTVFCLIEERLALKAKLSAYGEKFSTIVMNGYFNFSGLKARGFLAEEIAIITDDNFNDAEIIYKISERNVRKKILALKEIPVIAGFTGKTLKREVTTLGRGGTDTTACFIAATLRAEKVILWKDVSGVLSADPKIVPEAKTIPYLSYVEAEESGKVIHEKAIQYIKLFKTPAEIVSLTNPKHKTEITSVSREKKGAKIVSFKKDLTLFIITDETIKTNELLLIACGIFSKHKVNIILISNARYILQIVVDNNSGQVDKVFQELKSKVASIKISKVSMVFLIGNFDIKDVNNFNNLLIKHKTGLEISAFLYENCNRIEAIIKTKKIEAIIKVLYKIFIK